MQTATLTARRGWLLAQAVFWCLGLAIVVLLFAVPSVGLNLLWNVLVPVAPALLVLAPGIWRNVCPLGTTALAPDRFGFSLRKKLSVRGQGGFALAGVALLFAIVPLRHVILDNSGVASGIALVAVATLAVGLSVVFERKSGWCAGMCPVNAVEKLYGRSPLITVANVHCASACKGCVAVCPDSERGMHPLFMTRNRLQKWAGFLIVGAFPGFVWGWFHVPNYRGEEGWSHLAGAYGWPMGSALATFLLFLALRKALPQDRHNFLLRGFATTAVVCYYWYRLPALIGFGLFPGDGMLVDLSATRSIFTVPLLRLASMSFFVWYLLGRDVHPKAWTVRPQRAVVASPEMA